MGSGTAGGQDGRAEAVLRQIEQLRRRATSLARNRADAEDLLQDTLERALRGLPRLRVESNVGAWMNTLMNHRFIDGWRMGRRMRPLEAAQNIAALPPEPPPPWSELTDADINGGIDDLPRPSADILRLRYFRRLSYAEISRRLGLSCDTVGTRLFRARRRLQQILTAKHLQPRLPDITPLPVRNQRPASPAAPPAAVQRRGGSAELTRGAFAARRAGAGGR